jgi:hypothetical protein
MKLVIKLEELACLEQQERGSDEIYVLWSFHEKSAAGTKERLPAGKATWVGQTGSRQQLDLEVVSQDISPDKEYAFDLWLYEQDNGLLDKDDLLGQSSLTIKGKTGTGPQILRTTDKGAEYELIYEVTLT